jgi:hypothetical protein
VSFQCEPDNIVVESASFVSVSYQRVTRDLLQVKHDNSSGLEEGERPPLEADTGTSSEDYNRPRTVLDV